MQQLFRDVRRAARRRLRRLAPRTRASSTASRPRTRATCRSGPIWRTRDDAISPRVGARLYRAHSRRPRRAVSRSTPCWPGRRNNPPEPGRACRCCGLRPDSLPGTARSCSWISSASLTGKSPSTTGAGTEGALTKGPFNALPPIVDLNNALVSLRAHRATRASPRPPATSGRTTASITTSACWCPEIWCPHVARTNASRSS